MRFELSYLLPLFFVCSCATVELTGKRPASEPVPSVAEKTPAQRCAAGQGDCDGDASDGSEIQLSSSSVHCGDCDRTCPDGLACQTRDLDGDGFEDESDACPEDKEVFNGRQDSDGCPDKGESLVEVDENERRIRLLKKIRFQTMKDIFHPKRQPVLEHLAAALKAYSRFTKIEIEGHSDGGSGDRY